ncbi:hypothetical protein Veis_1861 [Verminephrobacter eiseniae EF01-2]|uniref:Uncharacterized protein n=1 Tax=Verminephrobacter eiseniae (strain EF01-2) TaxID=391735 RepID=A1WJ07_VEREI|nr:hypothetical protein Veis_1861 [Verminephrobacter eiseniae EF01-2]
MALLPVWLCVAACRNLPDKDCNQSPAMPAALPAAGAASGAGRHLPRLRMRAARAGTTGVSALPRQTRAPLAHASAAPRRRPCRAGCGFKSA